ncbi:MAG TPA: outer membrane protein assembly factor BamD [Candidatus Omnitrophota bacterium]|nr:outer membrane protein assembly factor BamD [Candidatus Omnitrophota bacterium]
MKRKVFIFICLYFFGILAGCVTLSSTTEQYREAVQDFREGREYFAVLNLKAVLKDDPQSPYAPQSAFAVGEYYYDNADYFNALKTLSDYIHNYPKHKGVVFAKLIIYKILTDVKREDVMGVKEDTLIKEIRKELFSQPMFLIFYDKKSPRSYKSLFKHSYLVYDYVDKIKVFRDDKNFIELSP